MELEELTFLNSVYKAKVNRQHSAGTKTEIQTSGTRQKAQRYTQAPVGTLSLTKEVRTYNGEKTVSSTSGAGKTGHLCIKE